MRARAHASQSKWATRGAHSLLEHDEQRTKSGRLAQDIDWPVLDERTSKRAPALWWPHRAQPWHGIAMSAEPVSAETHVTRGIQSTDGSHWRAGRRIPTMRLNVVGGVPTHMSAEK